MGFSTGVQAYDSIKEEKSGGGLKRLYVGAMSAVYRDGVYSDLNLSGKTLQYYDVDM